MSIDFTDMTFSKNKSSLLIFLFMAILSISVLHILHYYYLWPVERIAKLFPFPCPSKKFLHLECPLCGMGRSTIALLLGKWKDSLTFHRFGIPFLIFLICIILKETVKKRGV